MQSLSKPSSTPADIGSHNNTAPSDHKSKKEGFWNEENPNSLAAMKHTFNIFDGLFFDGNLKGKCHLVIRDSEDISREGYCLYNDEPRSLFSHLLRKPVWRCDIVVCRQTKPFTSGLKQAEVYENTLVHEMLHAYFLIFACYCSHGCLVAWELLTPHHVCIWKLLGRSTIRSSIRFCIADSILRNLGTGGRF